MTRELTPDMIARAVAESSLEYKLTDPLAFGLETASPLQLAICRIADGRDLGDLRRDPTVIRALGPVDDLPCMMPRELVLLSGIRTGKSLFAACLGYHMAQRCDVTGLREGEVPRVSIVSLKKDLADVVLGHLVGSVQRSPLLKRTLLGNPTGESVFFRHPTGCPIEVKVVAGSRAGASLVSRWSAGGIFDEFPRMVGGEDGVVNWDHERDAILNRLLPGSGLVHIGSPWAPHGPAYDVVTAHWGKPTEKMVVVRAPAYDMNPTYWTPERVEAAKGEPSYRTDVEADFATPEDAFYSLESITRCTRKGSVVVPPKAGHTYYASMDPATRGNGWTMAIATREGNRAIVVRVDEWIGSRDAPLDPGIVLAEAAGILASYGIMSVDSDQWMGDALIALGRQVGLRIHQWRYTDQQKAEKHLHIRTRMDCGEIELPAVPHVRSDLLHVEKRITATGVRMHLASTSDGRHADFAPTLMMVLTRALPEPKASTEKYVDAETRRMKDLIEKRWGKKASNW